MRMASSLSYWRKCCGIWVSLWSHSVTKNYSEPGLRDYYTSRVYIRVPLTGTNRWRNLSSHHSTTHFSTDEVAINDAARRALWSLCNAYHDQLHQSEFRHIPRRLSGSEETVVPAGGDDRIDMHGWPLHLTLILKVLQPSWTGTMRSCRTHKLGSLNWKRSF
jgi:hypothetical protein